MIPNVTSSTHLLNGPLLYRKDTLGGCSNVCIDNKFFHKEVVFLRKKLDSKQKNYLQFNTHNHNHTLPNPLFFQFFSTSPPQPPIITSSPITSNLEPQCFFCCLVSLTEWEIVPHLMCYLT